MHTAYLGPISYYGELLRGGELVLDEPYEKQTIRNRCEIAGAQGRLRLVVPVQRTAEYKAGLGPMCTKDLRISYQQKWQHQHWQSIVSAYRLSPFFDYVADDLHPFYERPYTFLVDLNQGLHEVMMNWLDLPLDVVLDSSVPLHDNYWQVFKEKNGFLADLSILDLVCNMGPEGVKYI